MKTTFVSAFLSIYDEPYQNKNIEWRLTQFRKLCDTGIPLAVICSRDCYEYIKSVIQYPNVAFLEPLDLSETWVSQIYHSVECDIELPNARNVAKDTKEYLLLMNAKTEFMKRAVEQNPWNSTHFAWIDFNIFHIFGGQEVEASEYLRNLAKRRLAPYFLTLPGCWGKEHVHEPYLMNDICWRFCGGFFIGSADRILEFHQYYLKYFESFLREKRKLVWEVNMWAWFELQHMMSVIWYQGDHNRRILEFHPENMYVALSSLPSCVHLRYSYPDYGEYIPTSTAYVCHKGKHIINTRLVNYWLHPNGAYLIKDPYNYIRTRNVASILDDDTLVPTSFCDVDTRELRCYGGNIYGLEDIRLYENTDGELWFIATSINYSGIGRSRMVRGKYGLHGLTECSVLIPPDPNSWYEKNWIPIVSGGVERFIYKWSPFEIGTLQTLADGGLQLQIQERWEISGFSNVRGSSPFVETEDGWIGVVHFSYEGWPRKYFHMLILLDKETLKPLRYTEYFVFNNVSIEFCVGFTRIGDKYYFWLSNFDRDPEVISIDSTEIPLLYYTT